MATSSTRSGNAWQIWCRTAECVPPMMPAPIHADADFVHQALGLQASRTRPTARSLS